MVGPSQGSDEIDGWLEEYKTKSSNQIKSEILDIKIRADKLLVGIKIQKECPFPNHCSHFKLYELQSDCVSLYHDQKMLEEVLEKRSNSFKFILED